MIKNKNKPKIFIEEKEFNVQDFYISELGYLMMRLYSEKDKTFLTHNIGKYDSSNNMFINSIKNEKEI